MSIDNSILEQQAAFAVAHENRVRMAADPLGMAHAHLVGIGGCGMSSIARALLASGVRVSGTDVKESEIIGKLRASGASIYLGHDAAHLGAADTLIYSTAINNENPEMIAARARGMRLLHRSEALALFLQTRASVLVTGTHGKTTTSTLVTLALEACGFDPWGFIGGYVPEFSGHTRVGGLGWAVAEADESDGTFERLPASHLIVTNIEDEHLDFWGTSEAMRAGYRRVIEKTSANGTVVMSLDDPGACDLRRSVARLVTTYSVRKGAGNFSAGEIELNAFSSNFTLYEGKNPIGRFEVGVPGLQNVSNAVAALALTLRLGGSPELVVKPFRDFHGVGRRFDVKGSAAGVTVVDDYAHHPTEISATVDAARPAARQLGGRLIVVFQPHRFTRTRDLLGAFAASFTGCDELILTDIYSAGEKPIDGVSIDALMSRMPANCHPRVRLVRERAQIAPMLAGDAREGDLVLTLGAGDNWKTGKELLELLSKR